MRRKLIATGLIALTAAFAPTAAQALIVNDSSSFDVAMGFTGTWNTTETAASNDAANPSANPSPNATIINGGAFTVGNFSVTVSASGALFSSNGVTFPDRVLTSGDGTSLTGYANQFTVSVTYTGPAAPLGFTPGSEAVTLGVDSLSIYAFSYSGFGGNPVNWLETTSGHTGSGPDVVLNETTSLSDASVFTPVLWTTSTDLTVAGSTSTTITRTFNFQGGTSPVPGDDAYNPFDGFIIQGTANFSYEIPEPASLGLLSLGALMTFRRRAAR